jgi:uncharacterized protein YegL
MKNQKQIFNLIILDESGSMSSIHKSIVDGFNELVGSIKGTAIQHSEQHHFVSLVTFNSLGIKTKLDRGDVSKLEKITYEQFEPDAMTPLFDAIGFSVNQLKKALKALKQEEYHVLVTILTDGEENASTEYDQKTIKKLIDALKETNWTFTYIGANHDVVNTAAAISISNTMEFSADTAGVQAMINVEKRARAGFFERMIRSTDFMKSSYYNEED